MGFSDDTSLVMNSKGVAPRGRSGASTRTPSLPTTTRSPARTRCMGTVLTRQPGPSATDERAWEAPRSTLRTTRAQSISGFSTSSHLPPRRTRVGRLVVA